ncbi:MAG TPA: SpoIIE family protein phosphatase [Steroidobacteraceae bacterium]|nr:SpoIIE family protein phosphatase [Steroidobacteraceae bacterium]
MRNEVAPVNIAGLEWSVAVAAMPGESESGDRHVVCPLRDGALVAAIDGLGHGADAALAARVAIDVLEQHAGQALTALFERCHEALRPTRGVTMSLATISTREHSVAWAGVGNVEGLVRRALPTVPDERLVLRNGVVGSQLPALQPSVVTLGAGDILVFNTDGVAHEAASAVPLRGPLQSIADAALESGRKRNDDALLLLVRYGRAES